MEHEEIVPFLPEFRVYDWRCQWGWSHATGATEAAGRPSIVSDEAVPVSIWIVLMCTARGEDAHHRFGSQALERAACCNPLSSSDSWRQQKCQCMPPWIYEQDIVYFSTVNPILCVFLLFLGDFFFKHRFMPSPLTEILKMASFHICWLPMVLSSQAYCGSWTVLSQVTKYDKCSENLHSGNHCFHQYEVWEWIKGTTSIILTAMGYYMSMDELSIIRKCMLSLSVSQIELFQVLPYY